MNRLLSLGLFGCSVVLLAQGCASALSEPTTVTISPQAAFVAEGQSLQFSATVTGGTSDVLWTVNGVEGGTSATGTIDAQGNYTAPMVTQSFKVVVTGTVRRDPSVLATASVLIVAPPQVATTHNPQVALYSITSTADANVFVQFGIDTTYGLVTWARPAPSGGGQVNIYVAGMRANTTYHMRAVVQYMDGTLAYDSDRTFTTGSLPTANLPMVAATTTPGMTPQRGVELLGLNGASSAVGVAVTDLAGNVLWGYGPGTGDENPVKLMPNGDFLINFSAAPVDGTGSIMQEVDLGGNIIWQMTAAQLNQALAAATCLGCNITVVGTHHDFALLPNGHLIVIASTQKVENDLIGFSSPVTVTGDVLIDLDQNHNPVWVWNEFDHLDVNRHPYMFPDWTHTNSVVYSPDDKALIISSRHQFWVMKIDYGDSQGTGNVLWRLGWQGDFTLMNGTDPVDWQYAQHDANVISSNSNGTFQMTMFDNGDNRVLDDSGDVCSTPTTVACYSRIPIFQIDELAKTATLQWIDNLSPTFSFFGGSARLLANGNIEFDECAPSTTSAAIYEVTQTTPPQTVWHMQVTGQNAYRAFRIPSLYPGVQW